MEELQLVWGWQPALYLFLGGMGAGAFLVAGVLHLTDKENNLKTISISMWAAFGCLALGLLLLLSELTNPLRGLLLWQSFSNGSSWMTFGAWAALCALIVFALCAVLTMPKAQEPLKKIWAKYPEKKKGLGTALVTIGIILAVCVAVYTGLLLMFAPGIPLWNTLLLPCLFTVSAFDTGVALVEIIAVGLAKKDPLTKKATSLLERSVVVLVILEGVVLLIFAATMLSGSTAQSLSSPAATAAASMHMLLAGQLAPYFWTLLVACGLVIPLIAALHSLISHKENVRAIVGIGAAGAIIGGCTLRFLILLAGMHADLLFDAVSMLTF